ncbi:response regulator transcription factor [Paludisphaera soli]|uniref:response regulator transcription factor n=1 Tax=Paludisphaera soli TaxID=2712865 RepID=UPI0013ECCCB8|nr:response regulator transcription factor [Paludisphaera soli]
MPGNDGRELLVRLKADPELAAIPVVAVSISENPQDVRHCYANGAAGYVVVRAGLAGLLQAARAIKDYWFEVVALPGS